MTIPGIEVFVLIVVKHAYRRNSTIQYPKIVKHQFVMSKVLLTSTFSWFSWIRDQQESEGVTPGEDVYIILRLDGRVRRSGRVILLWILVGHRKIYTTSVLKYEEFGQNPLYFETEIVLNNVISIV